MYCRSELRFRNYSITFPYCRLLLFSHASKTNITATDTSRPFGQPAFQMHPMNNIACCCIVQFHIHSPRIQGRVHVPVSERVDLESDSSWDGCESSTGYKASLGSGRPVLAGSHPFHSFRGVAVAVSAVETTEPLSCDKRRFCCSCCLPLQMLHLIGQHSRRLVALSLYRQQHQHKSWLDHCICTHMHTVSLLLGRTYITFLNRWRS